jgi:3-oxoacyl-[acyl-carrier protein] reductase/sorbitol-6-phosphate 2-dehydrogenase
MRLARDQFAVGCADIVEPTATVESIRSHAHADAIACSVDVADSAQVEKAIGETVERFGRLDVLVNNAGIAPRVADFTEITDAEIDRVFAVNVRGTLACCRAAAPIMKRQNSGRIISTASQAGRRGWPGWVVYSGSKAAVIAITQAMALELAPYNILVNCICPGTMDTEMTRAGFADVGEGSNQPAEELIKAKAKTIPLGRLGTPDDMAAMVAWLASDAASFTTGSALNLTGGEMLF